MIEVTFTALNGNSRKIRVLFHGEQFLSLRPGQTETVELPGKMALHAVTVLGGKKGDGVQVQYYQGTDTDCEDPIIVEPHKRRFS